MRVTFRSTGYGFKEVTLYIQQRHFGPEIEHIEFPVIRRQNEGGRYEGMEQRLRIGIISDTHGVLRPEAVEALAGVAHIVHAGDIGDPAVLEALGRIARVTAVRGNVDRGPWAHPLPETVLIEVAGNFLYVLHDLSRLDVQPRAADVGAVIFGHSHIAGAERRDGVLYFNPGSAGPRRFDLPATVGILEIDALGIRETVVSL